MSRNVIVFTCCILILIALFDPNSVTANCHLMVYVKQKGNVEVDCSDKIFVYITMEDDNKETRPLEFKKLKKNKCYYQWVVTEHDSEFGRKCTIHFDSNDYFMVGDNPQINLLDGPIDKILFYTTREHLMEVERAKASKCHEKKEYMDAISHWFESVKLSPNYEGYYSLALYVGNAADIRNKVQDLIKAIEIHIKSSNSFKNSAKDRTALSDLYYQFGYALAKLANCNPINKEYYDLSLWFFDQAINTAPSNPQYWQGKYKLQLDNQFTSDVFNTMNEFFSNKDTIKRQSDCILFLNEWATALSNVAFLSSIASGGDPRRLWGDNIYDAEIDDLYRQLEKYRGYFGACGNKLENQCKSLRDVMKWIEGLNTLAKKSRLRGGLADEE